MITLIAEIPQFPLMWNIRAMLKVILIVLLLIIGISTQSAFLMANDSHVAASSQEPDRNKIIDTLRKAVQLNETFKNRLDQEKLLDKQKIMLKNVEIFYEEAILPLLPDVIRLLSSGKDNEVAYEFFTFIISYENFADEELSLALGEIFLNNPLIVEDTFKKFEKGIQKYLLQKLEWGFKNKTYKDDQSNLRIKDRVDRLQRLREKQ